ncbi:ComEC/Rec2 family competence protein [Fulvivirga kasyanovii]|uniref:ComEC family competence protein n=1 Tax=Fulvivirga kasyanovii TaxID=396812 RepID=A0ABW9RU04_9BACT|nr:ComEC/Rec2 family competence protein [Fulvivirga kasyanovii]MTI27191.1 ComEC family competence protein [Fulvivirga kasyanovii]
MASKKLSSGVLHWIPYAFVRITAFFIAGILAGIYFGGSGDVAELFGICVALILLYGLVFFLLKKSFFSNNHIVGVVGFIAMAMLGYLRVSHADQTRDSDHIVHHIDETSYYLATLQDPGEERAKTIKFEAEVKGVKKNDQWLQSSGKIYLYIDKSQQLKYGDQLLIKGKPGAIKPPQNPGEFDYKKFLSFKNIHHQDYLREGDFQLIGSSQNPVSAFAFKARSWAAGVLAANVDSDRELGIVQALVLGIKDDLDDDTQKAYAASGATHVLAVSGLHVGIIYGIIFFLLSRFQTSARGRWIVAGICILVLWFYALLTGLSPSVLRAVTMFTFVIIGQATGRDSNIYNTLAISAFCILMYAPFLIMSLGFQLSYLAVLGIVYLQPRIYNLYAPDQLVLDKIWATTSVALAAQLATAPLCLLYFHQFPTYFFLSNIIVIPGAMGVLCAGLGVLALSFVPTLAAVLGWLLKWWVYGMNESIIAIRQLPFSQITNISITAFEAASVFGIIISFLIFFHYKKLHYAWSAVIFSLIFSVSHSVSLFAVTDKVTIYKINGHTAVDFMAQGDSYLYTDPDFEMTDRKVGFHVEPNHLLSGISHTHWLQYEQVGWMKAVNNIHVAWFRGSSFAMLDEPVPQLMKLKNVLKVDYVLVCKRFDKDMAWIRDNFHFRKVILDGSLSWYQANRFRKEAEELSLPYYSVYDNGAYELELN